MKQTTERLKLGVFLLALAITGNLEAAPGGNGGGGGKPGGGGDSGGISFARIQFNPFDGVRSDGVQACYDPADPIGPDGVTWDYWDHRDVELTDPDGDPGTKDGCDAGSTADVSDGGRLHFITINLQGTDGPLSSPRYLVLDFNNVVAGMVNPDVDTLYEGGVTDPPYDSTPGIDNVKTHVVLNNMFKSGATQDSLSITVRNCDDPDGCAAAPTGFTLTWVEDLNIQDTADPDVRVLTTDGTSAQADLFYDDPNTKSKKAVHLGRYVMPIHWTMRLVPSP